MALVLKRGLEFPVKGSFEQQEVVLVIINDQEEGLRRETIKIGFGSSWG
jgi:hypothetical protein